MFADNYKTQNRNSLINLLKKIKSRRSFIKNRYLSLLLILVITFSGCSSTSKSTLLGLGTGVTIGFATGAYFSQQQRNKNALIGSLTFGLIGATIGYFSHKKLEKRDQKIRRETLLNLEEFGVSGDFQREDNSFINFNQENNYYEN